MATDTIPWIAVAELTPTVVAVPVSRPRSEGGWPGASVRSQAGATLKSRQIGTNGNTDQLVAGTAASSSLRCLVTEGSEMREAGRCQGHGKQRLPARVRE